MNITAFSPALTLTYVCILLCVLMDVDLRGFKRKQRWLLWGSFLFLCVGNHLLCAVVGRITYARLMPVALHLPTFLLFLYMARQGVIKTAFMILTAIVFTAPTIIFSNQLNRFFDTRKFQLLVDVFSYGAMLLLTWFVFRKSFNYLIVHGNNRLFLLLSLVPLTYYAYMIIAANLDVSSITSAAGYVFRILPTVQVFLFYFLLPYIYISIREKMLMQSAQDALAQELSTAENQVDLMNETNKQTAVFRHDMRHQLLMLEGLLSGGDTCQVRDYLKTVLADLDAITPKRFCENETVNLLCSACESKAGRLGVALRVNARLPKQMPLSDTELCSVISNGLENALHAASNPAVPDKWVEFTCSIKQNKVFIQIRNPYAGQVTIADGRPVSREKGHGFGCYSIQAITQRNHGLCSFEAENGLFTLRLAFPLPDKTNPPTP